MYYFTIDAFAVSAAFRVPEAHTFQQTLPLPPVTTIAGLAGAALGMEYEEALYFRREYNIFFGVVGKSNGAARDLWKYQKIKAGETISAVLTKEILYDLELLLLFAAEDKRAVETLRKHFLNPCYALTMGSSDDLLKIRGVSDLSEGDAVYMNRFENTILSGDITGEYESVIEVEQIPLSVDIFSPRVFLLPIEFEFNNRERRVSQKDIFSFVDTPVQLKSPRKSLIVGEKVVPLL